MLAKQIPGSSTNRRQGTALPLFVGKLAISALSLWLVFRGIKLGEISRALPNIDYRWALFVVLVILAQFPFLALRLQAIMQGLGRESVPLTFAAANAVTAIYAFFAQVVPGLIGEGVRAWLLVRHGCSWREGLTGVVIDRCVGVAALLACSFSILLLPSQLAAQSGYLDVALAGYGGMLAVGLLGLGFAPHIVSLRRTWRHLSWISGLINDAHRVLLGPNAVKIFVSSFLVQALNIVAVWTTAQTLGFQLSIIDCAVLFTVMIGVTVVPISIGGWGVRELAVVSLLGAHGFTTEQALLFSICFGSAFVVVGLLGAIVWLLYPLPRLR